MEDTNEILVCASEYIKDRLYFVTLCTAVKPKSTANTHYFCIDEELVYENFYADFGPLNLCMLYHYCMKLNKKLKTFALSKKKIVHYTTMDVQKRLNAAYLIASYSIIYLDKSPDEAYHPLCGGTNPQLTMFRDASYGMSLYQISLMDCLNAVYKAVKANFFSFNDFDAMEYEHYERVENGDLNWIVPQKFIAFCGPHSKSKIENGYPLHAPESYFAYFRRHNVTTVIRLNKKIYDSSRFANAGFEHKDLFFIDGSTPSDSILKQFIQICEATTGALAVHCKAGLGRTGSLIACYIMKHYGFTARETIAWLRLCRPGCIIGHQQQWLEDKQAQMWTEGDIHRRKNKITAPIKHKFGIYSFSTQDVNNSNTTNRKTDHVSRILHKVDTMRLNDQDEDNQNIHRTSPQLIEDAANLNCNTSNNSPTQGDKLNQIKAMRRHSRSVIMSGLHNEESRLHTRAKSQPFRSGSGTSAAAQSPLKSAKSISVANANHGASVEVSSTSSTIKRPSRTTTSLAKRNTWLLNSMCNDRIDPTTQSSVYSHNVSTRQPIKIQGQSTPGSTQLSTAQNINLRATERIGPTRIHNTRQTSHVKIKSLVDVPVSPKQRRSKLVIESATPRSPQTRARQCNSPSLVYLCNDRYKCHNKNISPSCEASVEKPKANPKNVVRSKPKTRSSLNLENSQKNIKTKTRAASQKNVTKVSLIFDITSVDSDSVYGHTSKRHKGGKRTLSTALTEKEKTGPQSVKVLRRTSTQNIAEDTMKGNSKSKRQLPTRNGSDASGSRRISW